MLEVANYHVINADCREVMADMDINSIDCSLFDGPYPPDVHAAKGSDGRLCNWRDAKAFDFAPLTDYSVADSIIGVTKRWSVTFCANEQVGCWKDNSHGWWQTTGWWIKTNPKPRTFGD